MLIKKRNEPFEKSGDRQQTTAPAIDIPKKSHTNSGDISTQSMTAFNLQISYPYFAAKYYI